MKTNIKIIILFVTLFFLPPSFCKASFFEMSLKQDSMYTPGNINLNMKLTDEAKIEDNYQFKVSIFLAGTLIREQTIKADKGKPVDFALSVPEVFNRTEGRCRCELLIAGSFLEAKEVPVLLWPAIAPYKKETLMNTEIWVYDTSGKLLEIFKKMEVKVVDATFKTARDFGKPDIVFIGENTDPNNMQIVVDSINSVKTEPVVIYLRQKQFLREIKIEVPSENNLSKNIGLMKTNEFMEGLDFRDSTTLANDSHYLKIMKGETGRLITSYVDENIKDEKNYYSYLCTIRQKDHVEIYCQLPVTSGSDPRSVVLLKNILNYTASVINKIKAK